MTEEQLKQGIEERWGKYDRHRGHGRIWTGFFVLIVGGLLLLRATGAIFFPGWFFTWPMILIAFGLLSGLRHGFRGIAWLIILLIGSLFLFNEINHSWNIERYIGPIALIGVGLMIIARPRKNRWRNWRGTHYHTQWEQQPDAPGSSTADPVTNANPDRRDFIDITAVFGGVKKNVLSKSFKGGDIVSFMGGSEIDLTQADFIGEIRIDVTNIFGGTKLIIPPTWDVHNDLTAVFGGVDDKRQLAGVTMDQNKVLILDGTCLFGGIEIKSF